MDILIAMCLILSGVYTTTTFVLLLYCWRIHKMYSSSIKKMDTVADTIAKEHNAMAERLLSIQDAVNTHEFKLNGSSLNFSKK